MKGLLVYSSHSMRLIFDETMAAVCFSLGVVTGLRGITHDFPITIEQWMQFMSSTNDM